MSEKSFSFVFAFSLSLLLDSLPELSPPWMTMRLPAGGEANEPVVLPPLPLAAMGEGLLVDLPVTYPFVPIGVIAPAGILATLLDRIAGGVFTTEGVFNVLSGVVVETRGTYPVVGCEVMAALLIESVGGVTMRGVVVCEKVEALAAESLGVATARGVAEGAFTALRPLSGGKVAAGAQEAPPNRRTLQTVAIVKDNFMAGVKAIALKDGMWSGRSLVTKDRGGTHGTA
jgi:hypothetical protein